MSTFGSGHSGAFFHGPASQAPALERRRKAFDLLSEQGAGVSVAQVARRYAMNANLIFKWLNDPRYAPDDVVGDTQTFLPVEIRSKCLG